MATDNHLIVDIDAKSVCCNVGDIHVDLPEGLPAKIQVIDVDGDDAATMSASHETGRAKCLDFASPPWYCEYWKRAKCIDQYPPLPVIDAILLGFAEVNFCSSRTTGLAYIVALLIADTWLATLALISCTSGTLTAMAAGFCPKFCASGLAGYNSVLIGCAFAVFLEHGRWAWKSIVASLIGGSLGPFAMVSLDAMLHTPPWTLPFNLVALSALLYTQPFSEAATLPRSADWSDVIATDVLKGILHGISQIFVAKEWTSALVMAAGTFWWSPKLCASLVVASSTGFGTAWAVNADPAQAVAGLWGFNPCLTAMAVCTSFENNWRVLGLMIWASVATQLLSAGMGQAFATALKIPPCTLPFCIVATMLFGLMGNVRGYEKQRTEEV